MKAKPRKISKNRQSFIEGDSLTPNMSTTPSMSVNLQEVDTIEEMFRNEQNNNQEAVKEIFHEGKVKARSDISIRQVKLITKAYYLAEITGMPEIHQILNDFLTLSISKDRKSRLEYVQGLQARINDSMQQMANGMRGQFGK